MLYGFLNLEQTIFQFYQQPKNAIILTGEVLMQDKNRVTYILQPLLIQFWP